MDSDILLSNNLSSMMNISSEDNFGDDLITQEIEILKSIFDESLVQDQRHPNYHRIKINVIVPEGFVIRPSLESHSQDESSTTTTTTSAIDDATITSDSSTEDVATSSNAPEEITYPIVCLPAVTLGFELPRGYPNVAPHLFISCCWLSLEQMGLVIHELDSMREDGEMVMFKYIDWIKSNLITFLGIEKELTLSSADVDLDSPLSDYCFWEHNEDMSSLMSALPTILAHNSHESRRLFMSSVHTCPVCFCDDDGVNFDLLSCSHFTCRACTTQICKLNIESGDVNQIRCSDVKCGKPIDQNIVQKCVSEANFKKYTSSLKKTNGFTECTRCGGWAKLEPHSRSTFCEKCYFSMCLLCSKRWHPGTPCNYQPHMRHRMDTFYKGTLKVEDSNNIPIYCKPCPGCGVFIHKFEGCNKVTCAACNRKFCWICLKIIDSYEHFNTKCVLFEFDSGSNAPVRHAAPIYARVTGRGSCPRCKANLYRYDNNNHVICQHCRGQVCFACKTLIKGTLHFATGNCTQHMK